MLDGCSSLTSIDLSSLYTNKPLNPWDMFCLNVNLTYIDISSFKCIFANYYNNYAYLPDFGIIKLNKNCSNEILIPNNWTMIIID